MAFCQTCGSQIGDQQKFCPKCGEKQFIDSTPVSAPAQVASSNLVVEKPAQPYRKGFMTASNILSMIALAIYLVYSRTLILDLYHYPSIFGSMTLGYWILFLVIPLLLSIVSFVFGIISKHKVTLFISVFVLTIWMYPILLDILTLI